MLEDQKDISQYSDEEVLALSLQKPPFFEIIVSRYQEAFLRKARSILGNREEVEDVVQETFTKIYFNAGRFHKVPGASFKSWGYKILINTTFSFYKKLKKKEEVVALLDDELLAVLPAGGDFIEKEGIKDSVVSTLSRMPKNLSHFLHLHFIQDRPQKEIAEMEGMTVSAVKTRIHRAKKEFRKIEKETTNL